MEAQGTECNLSEDILLKFLKKPKNIVDLSKSCSFINKINSPINKSRKGFVFWFELQSSFEEKIHIKLLDGGSWKTTKVLTEKDQSMKRSHSYSKTEPSEKRFIAQLFREKLILVVYYTDKSAKKTATFDPSVRQQTIIKKNEELNMKLRAQKGINTPFKRNFPAAFVHSGTSYLNAIATSALKIEPEKLSKSSQVSIPELGDMFIFEMTELNESGLVICQDKKRWVNSKSKREEHHSCGKIWIKYYYEDGDPYTRKCIVTFFNYKLILVYYYHRCCETNLSSEDLDKHLIKFHNMSGRNFFFPTRNEDELFQKPALIDTYYSEITHAKKVELCKQATTQNSANSFEKLIYSAPGDVYVLAGSFKKKPILDVRDECKWVLLEELDNEQIWRASNTFYRSLEYFSEWNVSILRYFQVCAICGLQIHTTRYGDTETEEHVTVTHPEIFNVLLIDS